MKHCTKLVILRDIKIVPERCRNEFNCIGIIVDTPPCFKEGLFSAKVEKCVHAIERMNSKYESEILCASVVSCRYKDKEKRSVDYLHLPFCKNHLTDKFCENGYARGCLA